MSVSEKILGVVSLMNDIYTCTKDGKVWSLPRNYKNVNIKKKRRLFGTINSFGYRQIRICLQGRKFLIQEHRLIWVFFNGEIPKNMEVNHKDGNKLNNSIKNLELVTRSENIRHAFKLGLYDRKGENSNNAKLNEKDVIEIIKLRKFKTVKEIANQYKVTTGAIYGIISGNNWKHLTLTKNSDQ